MEIGYTEHGKRRNEQRRKGEREKGRKGERELRRCGDEETLRLEDWEIDRAMGMMKMGNNSMTGSGCLSVAE